MDANIKSLAILMPFAAAVLYGLSYCLYARALQSVNIYTFYVFSAVWSVAISLGIYVLCPSKISFASMFESTPVFWSMMAGFGAAFLAWLCTLGAIQNISPTYAAVGELSYPLFTALFAYLIFHDRQLDYKMVIGGVLIAAGSYIVISDKIKIGG